MVLYVVPDIHKGLPNGKPLSFYNVLKRTKNKEIQMKLRIAIQKSGRLYEDSVQLLKECGIALRNVKDRLKTEADNFPLEVFFLRDDDIPQYVEDGVPDIGIVGENVLYEKKLP